MKKRENDDLMYSESAFGITKEESECEHQIRGLTLFFTGIIRLGVWYAKVIFAGFGCSFDL